MEGGGGTDDGADVGGVHDVLQDGDAFCVGTELLHRRQGLPVHGAEHPTGQVEAGELGEHVQLGHVDGDVSAAFQEGFATGLHVLGFSVRRA